MKVQTFINNLKEIEGFGLQQFFEHDWDGACPCFFADKVIDGKRLIVSGRCWRVSSQGQELHIYSEHEQKELIAKEIKRALDNQKWHQEYTVIWHKEPIEY